MKSQKEIDNELMPPPATRNLNSAGKNIEITVRESGKVDNNNLDVFPMVNGPQRASASTIAAPDSTKPSFPVRKKVGLAPGRSPLDWAVLQTSGSVALAGVEKIERYTLAQLKERSGNGGDRWLAYNGKVYNIEMYIDFHPGGRGQILRGVNKDSTELINKIHPWVNIDMMLNKCLVGYLINE